MIRIITGLVCLLVISSCSNFGFKDLQGAYNNKEFPEEYILLNGKQFVYMDTMGRHNMTYYVCCDTLSYGMWELDSKRQLLYLNSLGYLWDSDINMEVEEFQKYDSNFFYFQIENPMEDFYRKTGNRRDIYYQVGIELKNSVFWGKEYGKKRDSNFVKIPKTEIIDRFSVSSYPGIDFRGNKIELREINSTEYKVKNSTSNFFVVQMNDLTYGRFTYQRLRKDIVKIISKRKLEWNGKIFERTR